MHYFFFCRDNPGVGALRKQTEQAHWAFMDDYAAGFVARGPTLTDDGTAQTGSMHIVDLPDAAAVHRFAYEEPRHKVGLYGEVAIGRWRNESGRTNTRRRSMASSAFWSSRRARARCCGQGRAVLGDDGSTWAAP